MEICVTHTRAVELNETFVWSKGIRFWNRIVWLNGDGGAQGSDNCSLLGGGDGVVSHCGGDLTSRLLNYISIGADKGWAGLVRGPTV